MCFEGLARLSRRVRRRFVRGSREISLVPSLHRASTDALIILGTMSIPIILSTTVLSDCVFHDSARVGLKSPCRNAGNAKR